MHHIELENTSWREPLFIVGASRSGTAMLRSMLIKNSSLHLVGETHYFDDLRPRFMGRQLREMTKEELERCCDYFRAQTDRPYGKKGDPERSWLSRGELLSFAESIGTDVDSIFEAYCKLSAKRAGAIIWGEKTPRHIFRINEIYEKFPKARVICMTRDPRAVVASYRDWKYQGGLRAEGNVDYEKAIAEDEERTNKSYHIIIASMMWRAAANAALEGKKNFTESRVKIVKYEDIVNSPNLTLNEICGWLDIDYQSKMLEIPLHNSSAIKYTDAAGVSTIPEKRWRQVLSQDEISIIQKFAGKSMVRCGYKMESCKKTLRYTAKAYLTLPQSIWRAAHANRSRYDSLPKYVVKRLRAALNV